MSYEHVTLCFSLPRSRSHWLAWVYGHAIPTWHDPLGQCDHPLDLREMIDADESPRLFIADTSAILFHTAITDSLPGAQFLYVLRDPRDVCASLKRQTLFPQTSLVQRMNARLHGESHKAPPENVCAYPNLDYQAWTWWERITGEPIDRVSRSFINAANTSVVDVPVQQQQIYPEKRYALMLHQEPTGGC